MNFHVNRVIDEVDNVFLVLDARHVKETRSSEIESLVKRKGKKLFFVVNKCDLANPEVPKNFFRVSAKELLGTSRLRDFIKSLSGSVGFVGYANTGKSALIRVLGGKAKSSTTAGFTRGAHWTKIGKTRVLDSPGVIPSKESREELFLKGALNVSKLKDPESFAVQLLGSEEALEELAVKWNFLKRGGKPDTVRAAKKFLSDLQ